MRPKFIFQKDVEALIREGKKELIVPEGCRISSAALDLIKEKNILVKFARKEGSTSRSPQPAAEPVREKEQSPPEPSITEQEVDEIVRRVIQRFKEAKGLQHPHDGQEPSADEQDDNLIICRCEEITKGEIKEAIRSGISTLNGIKRITRAGMGLCQGQTCERLVSQILSEELGIKREQVEPTTARAPVRPVPISIFATG